jgi:hypothetical protein
VQPEGSLEEDAVRATQELSSVFDKQRDALLLSFDFAIHAVRDEAFRSNYVAYHRDTIDDMAGVIRERLTKEFDLQVPPQTLAAVFDAVCNGVAFERLVDPDALPDEVFGRLLAAVVETFTTRRDG